MTEGLTFYSLFCGFREITEKTIPDIYARIALRDKVEGCLLSRSISYVDEGGHIKYRREDRPITIDDLKAHIGMTTNASVKTWTQFSKSLTDNARRDLERKARNLLDKGNQPE